MSFADGARLEVNRRVAWPSFLALALTAGVAFAVGAVAGYGHGHGHDGCERCFWVDNVRLHCVLP